MASYSKEFRQRTVARLMPPESAEISVLSAQLGIPAATLERWHAEALSAHSNQQPTPPAPPRTRSTAGDEVDQRTAHSKQPTNTLQTLDRGLSALTLIAQQEDGMSISELAAALDVHRAIAYRIAATLEVRGLIVRAPGGRLRLGPGLLTLASRFEPQLRLLAQPILRDLAESTQAAAFLSVPAGEDCVAIMVIEPEGRLLRVAYRVGIRHPLDRGAAGIAILAGRPVSTDESESVRAARRDGFSVTHGELQKGAVGVASPVHGPGRNQAGFEASIGVVAFEDLDVTAATRQVLQSARALTAAVCRNENRPLGAPKRP